MSSSVIFQVEGAVVAPNGEALGEALQKQEHAVAGLTPAHHFEMVLVASHVVANHTQQLAPQTRRLRGDGIDGNCAARRADRRRWRNP